MSTQTPSPIRSRMTLRVGLPVIVVAAGVLLALLVSGGSSEQPPDTGAATVIPSDALAYVNVSIDSRRPAVKRALTLAKRFPSYALLHALLQSRLGGLAGGSGAIDFPRDIRPWLGDEVAVALLNTPTSTAGSLVVLDVRDRDRAQSFLTQAGAQDAGSYRGVQLRSYSSGTELAFLGRFLVLGQSASVQSAIDVSAGRSSSLKSNPAYSRAAADEPDDRALDAYISAAGVRRVLAPQRGILGGLGTLLYQPALTGATISLSASSKGLRARVHSALDPKLAKLGNPRRPSFTPTLDGSIPSGSMLMLDVTGLGEVAPRVLGAGAASGFAGRLGPLLTRLGRALASEGVNVRDLVSLFSGETALALTPGAASSSSPQAASRPALTIVARTHNEQRTRSELAAAELPLEQLFPTPGNGTGSAPVFTDHQADGATIHQLALAPGLEFDYAVAHGLVVLSTSLGAANAVVTHRRALRSERQYQRSLPPHLQQVTSLLFLDFTQFLNLAEQTGLTRGGTYRTFRADLHKVRTAGLESTGGEADSTAELSLQIS